MRYNSFHRLLKYADLFYVDNSNLIKLYKAETILMKIDYMQCYNGRIIHIFSIRHATNLHTPIHITR